MPYTPRFRSLITESKLAGRGGAGFPTGKKWEMVAEATGNPKTIVCKADEGEPGCFKDRALLDYDPHATLEGMILAALATGATRGFIYLRYEYPDTQAILERAIAEAGLAGFWPHRLLERHGIASHIVDPAPLAVPRSGTFTAQGQPFPTATPPHPRRGRRSTEHFPGGRLE